jgi:ubiquinone/menaquinone biosynthesis C-methylase UbiE
VEKPFRKDLTHLTWDEVYARQAKRAHLVGDWMDALRLKAGDRVLEVGAGPGYVSLVLADRVGPGGAVYAIDHSAEALAYLERLQNERGVSQIRRIIADAATLEPTDLSAGSALIAMVLHHTEDAAGILDNVARLLPASALAVVAEFHPEGPCEVGPPRAHRVKPEQVQAWCKGAGFVVRSYRRQTPEHYMVLVEQRRMPAPSQRAERLSKGDETPSRDRA